MLQSVLRRLTKYVAITNTVLAACAAAVGFGLALGILYNPNAEREGAVLRFTAVQDATASLDFKSALPILRAAAKRVDELATDRSEVPFWLESEEIVLSRQDQRFIEIPSRHVARLSYQFIDDRGRVVDEGSADRYSSSSKVRIVRAGFAIQIPKTVSSLYFVGRISSIGPARLSLATRSDIDLEAVDQFFDRSGGVLFGSLLMIAAFSFLISLLARDFIFFLFGAWVISSLRLASYSAGWDMGWFGYLWIEEFPKISRNIPLAAYAFFTVSLFWAIFKRDVAKLKAIWIIRTLFTLSLGLLIAGSILSHKTFLPLLWGVVIPSVAILISLTVRIYLRTGSSAAAWYGASWLAALVGVLGDVAYAAGLATNKPALANSLASSVAAALLAGIAIAQRLNSERSGRLAAQQAALTVLGEFRENYNSMPVGLFSILRDGTIKLYNPAFGSMFGLSANHDLSISGTIDTVICGGILDILVESAASGSAADVEFHTPTSTEHSERWFLARVTSKGDSIEGSIQEITQRKHAEAKLRHLVDHDSLTGLRNRRGLEQAVSEASKLVDTGVPCAVAHVAMDRFKLINDLYGHATGDAMLQQAANRLLQSVRSRDHIARLADSFVVVFLDCPDFAVMGLSERLRESINDTPFELDGKRLDMTVSVGVVSFDPKMGAVDTMAASSRACAEAKARGRNCVVRLDDRDTRLRSHLEELKVVADLQRKITTDRYFLDFQPIVALQSPHGSLSYEVLLRMRDENGGVIPPGRFIGAAERNGLMSDIDRWVLRSTLEWMDAHPQHRNRLSFATINISGASLNDARFVDDAFSMIADHPLAMPKLCFEITESVALNDIGSTRRFIDRVRMYGSKLALDDFGAGYTSFNYLKEIPADFIKIDGSFVRDINSDPANYAITRTIVDLTHELGMQSIAEWAETPDTVASLIELKVDYGQGFGLARPMDKRIVTNALSCGELVKDEQVLRLLTASESMSLALHGEVPFRLQ